MKPSLLVLALVLAACRDSAEPLGPAQHLTAPLASVALAGGVQYQAVDLGIPGLEMSQALAVNDAGAAVGFGFEGFPDSHALLWVDGVRTLLDPGPFSGASDINNSGVVAGHLSTGQAVLWHGGTVTEIGTLGGRLIVASPVAINEQGQVAGVASDQFFFTTINRAFLWDNGVMTDLGAPGGTPTVIAADLNNHGTVVGYFRFEPTHHAFSWQDGVMTDLGALAPPGATSVADDVNDAGQVVGRVVTPDGVDHAVLWQNGTMTDLGSLGGVGAVASAINELGQITGRATTADGFVHAFLWQNGVMMDLGAPPGGSSSGLAINNRGQVAGDVIAEGTQQAFLWDQGVMHSLPGLAGNFSFVGGLRALNEQGQVVGTSLADAEILHAVLWTPGPGNSALTVTIDIKPGSTTNPINLSSFGVIPVAILSVGGSDATTVDPLSVRFGPGEATEAHGGGHVEDVNGDGVLDLVLHFRTQESGLVCGATSAGLTGTTFGGEQIQGIDVVMTVNCPGGTP